MKKKLQHLYQNSRSNDSSALVLSKNSQIHKKIDKISSEWKKYAFAFSHFNNFFVTYSNIPAIFNFSDLVLSELYHSQSPQHYKTYLHSLETNTETHLY